MPRFGYLYGPVWSFWFYENLRIVIYTRREISSGKSKMDFIHTIITILLQRTRPFCCMPFRVVTRAMSRARARSFQSIA